METMYMNSSTGEITKDKRTAINWLLYDKVNVYIYVNGVKQKIYWET